MLPRRLALVLTTFVFLVAARHRAVQHPAGWPLTAPPADEFTLSQPAQITTSHVSLDLTVDFAQKRLRGSAALTLENLTGTRLLRLDTYHLDVTRVVLDGNTPATWTWGPQTAYSRALDVTIEPSTRTVTIDYTTSDFAPGLYWNTAEQSFGRKEPYLYSLNEPVAARSWIPLQDTPTVRHTYDAILRVPRGLLALMSASNNPTAANDTGVYRFDMTYPIPSYLIALAVGRLEFHAFDERTGVYAEPELLADAAWELQYLPEMVDVAEGIAGPYPFGRYDLLLMPPTFVVGGMEHPMLNFIAPFHTITGNRPSNPEPHSLVAHELAHSWAGDSTTLANWNDVWLNEGITSYLTLRILEEMAPERAAHSWYVDRRNYGNYASAAGQAAHTILHRDVERPGEGFDFTGYTKGELFIKTLEDTLGRERFDFFLRRYFQIFAFRWVDHLNFLALLRELAVTPALEAQLRLDEWLYQPGLPSNVTAPVTSAIQTRTEQRADAFSKGTPFAQLQPETWTQVELDLFLQITSSFMIRSRMSEIDAALGLSARNIPPYTWLVHAIHARYEPAMAGVERALLRGGPGGWISGLYDALLKSGQRDRAVEIFHRARKRYAAHIEQQVAEKLGLASALPNAA